MDKNNSRERKKNLWAKNKAAFDEIIGDPFSPDYIDGVYNILSRASSVGSIEATFGESPERVYNEKPSVLDFFCDVDLIIKEVLEDDSLRDSFYITYIVTDIENPCALSLQARNSIEQQMGKLFRARGISPVQKYFSVFHKGRKR